MLLEKVAESSATVIDVIRDESQAISPQSGSENFMISPTESTRIESRLPWNQRAVRSIERIQDYLKERLPRGSENYLPGSITLFADFEVPEADLQAFLVGLVDFFPKELSTRAERSTRFVELGLFDESEMRQFLTDHRHAQHWIIYYSKTGGLGEYKKDAFSAKAEAGVVPCFRMQNHGVAWRTNGSDDNLIWLATSRRPGEDWDWESDIGHESSHAAFAPVPLFTLPAEELTPSNALVSAGVKDGLSEKHLASICYLCSELAVVAVRGERRDTETGLPVLQTSEELPALLAICHDLMPALGFDRALEAFSRVNGVVDCNAQEIFEIGSPAMRFTQSAWPQFGKFTVPDVDWFRAIPFWTKYGPKGPNRKNAPGTRGAAGA